MGLLPQESWPSPSEPVSSQRLINIYAEFQATRAKAQVPLFGSPGVVTAVTCGGGPVRGAHVMAGMLYAVSGSGVYSISNAPYTATLLASGITGSGPVSIEDNGYQLMIVNGTVGWTYDTTNLLAQVISPNFKPAKTVAFFDQYFVFDAANTNTFFVSALLNGQSYAGDAIATAESSSDFVVAVKNLDQLIYIFGQSTIEPWYDAAGVPFPFLRYGGGAIPRGCAAPLTVTEEDSALFFLGDDIVFYRLAGTQITRVSSHAAESVWQKYTTVSDAVAFPILWRGHKFIQINFPAANATWVYDIATGKLHERESLDSTGRAVRSRINCVANAYGKVWVGDAQSGKVGYLNADTFTEFDSSFYAHIILPNIHADGRRVFMPLFELDAEAGTGNANDPGADPMWWLSYSDDGGKSYVPNQYPRRSGKIGQNRTRLQWPKMGSFYQRTIKLTCGDPIKRVAIDARTPRLYAAEA